MTGLAMGCPTPELQGGIKEPETNPSFSQQKEQTDATRGEVITECDQDVDYKPGGSEPEIKAVNEEEENSDAECAKMELPPDRTLCQRTMNHKAA